jgi:hypothetical protein
VGDRAFSIPGPGTLGSRGFDEVEDLPRKVATCAECQQHYSLFVSECPHCRMKRENSRADVEPSRAISRKRPIGVRRCMWSGCKIDVVQYAKGSSGRMFCDDHLRQHRNRLRQAREARAKHETPPARS